ncbi:astacin, partial [Teladorsagia circumcincta]
PTTELVIHLSTRVIELPHPRLPDARPMLDYPRYSGAKEPADSHLSFIELLLVGVAVHEIGHTLGFWHTHSRHDRDEFITVIKENINCSRIGQFMPPKTMEINNNYNLTYDYGSVMHYGATAFINDTAAADRSKLTMVSKDVLYKETLGSPIISFYDLLMMNLYYNCTDACGAGPDENCRNGGFAHPRNCSKCICPSGYGGQFCDERPPGCGAVLNASENWQLLEDHLNATEADKDGYKRFCSSDAVNITLASNLSMVPVITFKAEGFNGGENYVYEYEEYDGGEEVSESENGNDEHEDTNENIEDLGTIVRLAYRFV